MIDPPDVRWIWLTHPDRDHTGGLFALLEAAPQARVVTTFVGAGIMSTERPLPMDRIYLLNPKTGKPQNPAQPYISTGAVSCIGPDGVTTQTSGLTQINGFTKDFPVEKYYRDVRLCTVGEGTSEIQKLVIARQLLGKA